MRWMLVSVVALSVVPGTASAQLSESDERARVLFQAGQVHFESGEYEHALPQFQAAYELSGRAGLLYNIGLTLERMGSLQEALEAFERFLATGAEVTGSRAALERRVAALRRRVERLAAGQPDPGGSEEGDEAAVAASITPGTAASDDSGVWIGVGVGVGVAVVAAAVVLAVVFASPQQTPYEGTLFTWRIP